MKTKKRYIAPTLERHLYVTENGFAFSILGPSNSPDQFSNGIELWGWDDNPGGGTGGGNTFGGDDWTWE